MPFQDDEESVSDSAPVELYVFTTPASTYRYVSNYGRVYSFGGNDYDPAVIERSEVTSSPVPGEVPELTISIPASSDFAQENLFGILPRRIGVTVTRVQQFSATAQQWWSGIVAGATVEGRWARLRSPSTMDDPLATELPNPRCHSQCQHVLYDNRCRVVATDFDVATTVASVDSTGRTITVAGVGGNPDGWFKAGKLVHGPTGDQRLIKAQTGTSLQISYPFRSIANGDAVTLFAGCDHRVTTCRDKFSNVENFGGFPWMTVTRGKNPFVSLRVFL